MPISQRLPSMEEIAKRYAVVTGANKGLGWGIVKLLASKGVTVVLTARDERRGLEAVGKLKESGLSDNVVFHQLDMAEPASIASLAEFIKSQYGKLDILVNNAGVSGTTLDTEALAAATISGTEDDVQNVWRKVTRENYNLAEECLNINYYGAKIASEALIPLLQLSTAPKIVNISSTMGKLKHIPNDWVKGVLGDVDSLTEDTIDELLSMFLNDFKEGCLETKGWPSFMSAYIISKVALNAYTRILSKKHPSFSINCICRGFVRTDMNNNTGTMSVEEAAVYPVRLALLPGVAAPSGRFFSFYNAAYSFYE